ncbi:MAG: diguanylate cyclase [Pseudomonas fragi]
MWRLLMLTWLLGRELHLRQRAERQLEALATTDPLTGLANRRKLDQTLEQEWRRAQRSGKPLSLIMFDIDHFKNFNDTYGHQDGDEALKRVAQTIRHCMHRSTDLAARYGGEEFAVVLSDTDGSGAITWRRVFARQSSTEPLTPTHRRLTTSMGVSTRQVKPGDQLAGLINSADQALYQAREGRAQLRHQCPGVVLSEYPP